MLPFILYFATGVVTGVHLCTLLLVSVYGVPVSPLEGISLLGSFCLLMAAYISLVRPRIAARIALIAALALWCFYGPAIAGRIRARSSAPPAALQSGPRLRFFVDRAGVCT